MLEADRRESIFRPRDQMRRRGSVGGLLVGWESWQARAAVIGHVLRRRGQVRRRWRARLDSRNLLDVLLEEGVKA